MLMITVCDSVHVLHVFSVNVFSVNNHVSLVTICVMVVHVSVCTLAMFQSLLSYLVLLPRTTVCSTRAEGGGGSRRSSGRSSGGGVEGGVEGGAGGGVGGGVGGGAGRRARGGGNGRLVRIGFGGCMLLTSKLRPPVLAPVLLPTAAFPHLA